MTNSGTASGSNGEWRSWNARHGRREDHRAAHHEAGHVVAAKALGLDVREAWVANDGTGAGRVLLWDRATLEQERIFRLAGDMWCQHHTDRRIADGYRQSTGDAQWRAQHPCEPKAAQAAEARCMRLLTQHRELVVRIADQLLDRGALRWERCLPGEHPKARLGFSRYEDHAYRAAELGLPPVLISAPRRQNLAPGNMQ